MDMTINPPLRLKLRTARALSLLVELSGLPSGRMQIARGAQHG